MSTDAVATLGVAPDQRIPVAGYEFLGGLTQSQSGFREELLTWLAEHLVGEWAALKGVGGPADDEAWYERVEWEKELGKGGWRGIGWPAAYGGRNATYTEQLIFELEYARSAAPYRPSLQGENLFGPTMLQYGTEEQKLRFLPPILRGEEFWAQGFSEPDAGSDLAGVRTRAVLDGDRWVLNGQKIWTTFGQYSQWIYVLCRTDLDAESKHRSLSFLLVPLDQPGIEMRPIRTLAGNADFNEVFFTEATTARELVLGDVNEGWAVAMALLGFERGTTMLTHQMSFEHEFVAVRELVRSRARGRDPVLRQRLAELWSGLQLIKLRNFAMVSTLSEGGSVGSAVSLGKLAATTWHQQLGELEMDLLGPEALILADGYPKLDLPHRTFLHSRAETIYGGSSEIQKNIVAERILGLPR
jgi:alkylation response protein AidB-like acyl-CoA dehydrogenase